MNFMNFNSHWENIDTQLTKFAFMHSETNSYIIFDNEDQ
jgi:hypothetical protein